MTFDQITAREIERDQHCEDLEMERDAARAAMRKWRTAAIAFFVVGTIQWIACNFT